MATGPDNPYAAPRSNVSGDQALGIDQASLQKIEAIIKDAGQFWMAILICLICTGIGMLIIGPWYLVRLVQWSGLAKQYPVLLDRSMPRGSLPQRFQAAKSKLIIGIVFGVLIVAGLFALLIPAILAARNAAA
jgi:hypothetical protein